ncbi:MAG: hypothetical protein JWP30_1038 [Homoserinimonas sp.]|jgi:hypothetical protein|nr:hypothetical protein [Homoserinimonas sp.]
MSNTDPATSGHDGALDTANMIDAEGQQSSGADMPSAGTGDETAADADAMLGGEAGMSDATVAADFAGGGDMTDADMIDPDMDIEAAQG